MKFWSKITFNYGYILDFVGNHSADVWLFKLAFESVCEVGEGFHKLWGLEPKNYMTFICNHKIRLISYCSDSSVRRMTLGLYFQPPNPFPTHSPPPPPAPAQARHILSGPRCRALTLVTRPRKEMPDTKEEPLCLIIGQHQWLFFSPLIHFL